MSLTSDECEILETILLNNSAMKAAQIATENNKELQNTVMHLTNLTRGGYIDSPQKEQYNITDEGKKALGFQLNTKETAKAIIAYAPHDKAFNFYADTDRPLRIHAHSLQDFINKLSKVDVKSIEFHMDKDDFETWFKCLGDQELAKKTAIIKERKNTGEQLRQLLHNTVEQHHQKLMKLTEQTTQ